MEKRRGKNESILVRPTESSTRIIIRKTRIYFGKNFRNSRRESNTNIHKLIFRTNNGEWKTLDIIRGEKNRGNRRNVPVTEEGETEHGG